jgi:hypothetical protein
MTTVIIAALLPVLNVIIAKAAPEARAKLVEFVRGWRQDCLNSTNPWDDMASFVVAILLGISIDDIVPTNPDAVNMSEEEKEELINGEWTVDGEEVEPPPGPDRHPKWDP